MLLGYELVLGTRWFGYELVVGTSRLGYDLVLGTSWLRYELARYDLEWVRVDLHPPFMTSGQETERVNYFNTETETTWGQLQSKDVVIVIKI